MTNYYIMSDTKPNVQALSGKRLKFASHSLKFIHKIYHSVLVCAVKNIDFVLCTNKQSTKPGLYVNYNFGGPTST